MKVWVRLAALSAALFAMDCYGSDSLRARIADYDWSAFEAELAVETTAPPDDTREIDIDGLRQDTGYFLSYQLASIAILYVMPEGISGWSEESKDEYSLRQWKDNVSHPHWDEDDYFINYVLHPYWGASYYVRARDRGLNKGQSIWYSALLSTLYEYGFEALFERPSIQDLVVTPIGAVLAGEYFFTTHKKIRERHAAGVALTTRDRWILVLTDPLGAVNDKVKNILGRDAEFSVRSFAGHNSPYGPWSNAQAGSPPNWNDADVLNRQPHQKVVGLQLKITF